MADVAKRLIGPQILTTASTTYYTAPSAVVTILRNLHIANIGTVPATFTINMGVDNTGNRWWQGVSVAPGGFFDWVGFQIISNNEILSAYASVASTLNLTLSGVEAS